MKEWNEERRASWRKALTIGEDHPAERAALLELDLAEGRAIEALKEFEELDLQWVYAMESLRELQPDATLSDI